MNKMWTNNRRGRTKQNVDVEEQNKTKRGRTNVD